MGWKLVITLALSYVVLCTKYKKEPTETVYFHLLNWFFSSGVTPGLWWHISVIHHTHQYSSYVSLTLMLPSQFTGGFIQFVRVGIHIYQYVSLSLVAHMPCSPSSLWDSAICASGHHGTWWQGPPAIMENFRLSQSAAQTQQGPAGHTARAVIDGQL